MGNVDNYVDNEDINLIVTLLLYELCKTIHDCNILWVKVWINRVKGYKCKISLDSLKLKLYDIVDKCNDIKIEREYK